MINWFKILYTDLISSVIVNNSISEPVNISRFVKQGYSLSPLLYKKMCLDREIKGIKLPRSNSQRKIPAFPDDRAD